MSNPNSIAAEVFGKPRTHEEVLTEIKSNRETYEKYLALTEAMQNELVNFLTGESSLNILYDNFFRKIFNPDEHRERVERLISALIGQKVKIKAVLSREGSQIIDKGSFVIMDIIVELEDGSFVDVEMQKMGYMFPSQRSSCYVSDMIMRQYNRRKEEYKDKFSYKGITPVYLFVLMEKSSEEFAGTKEYIHKREVSYSSGIELPETARITYITLDSFKENEQNINEELEAWLSFLIRSDIESVVKLISAHPEFSAMYKEIAEFRKDPKELTSMFSEALYIMDRNTEKYMVDELKERVELVTQRAEAAEQRADNAEQRADNEKQRAEAAEKRASEAETEVKLLREEISKLKQ